MKIQLGDKVRDRVTGFTGIAVARTEWLNGCFRISIQSQKLDKDGKTSDLTCDEPQIELVKAGVVKCGPRDTGGPIQSPVSHASATR